MPHLVLECSANVPDEPDLDLVLLRESFPRARAERRCDLTVELREMQPEPYFKSAG